MKTNTIPRIMTLLLALSFLMMSACDKESITVTDLGSDDAALLQLKSGSNGATSYIVVLRDDAETSAALAGVTDYDQRKQVMTGYLNRFLHGKGIGNDQVDQVYSRVFAGFSARLSQPQVDRLMQDPRIASIEPDQEISLGKPGGGGTPPAQVIPWGIGRIGGPSGGTGKTAWIIDSGIDLDHPDLVVDVTRSRTFLGSKTTPDDQNGHGTHVAGIIAAKDNTIGVVGVAAGATVVSVRVLGRSGTGLISGIIAGCDYVAGAAGSNDVANMSLGGGISSSLDQAVLNMSGQVRVALAAGNESDDANNHSPARVDGPNVYTVSAMNSSDSWASFSNYGNPPVDYCAPGVNILSCYKNAGYAYLNGTSMAAPHVAGLLLLGAVHADGEVSGDPDGDPDLIAHK